LTKNSTFNFTAQEPKKQKLDVPDSDVKMTRRQAAMLKNFDPFAPSPFTKLPEEVLENIFNFLDRKSLLNCLLVNSRWNLVIDKSSKLMKSLPLNVDFYDGAQHLELKKTHRKPIPKRLIEALTKIGANVKTINFSGNGANFSELLGCFPNAETIIINQFWSFNLKFCQLPNVKTLKIVNSAFYGAVQLNAFFSMFPKVKHLHLIGMSVSGVNNEDIKVLTSNLKHVKSLTITGTSATRSNVRIVSGYFRFVNQGAFDNLRELKLKSFNASELISWAQVIANNPKLQVIDIEIERNQNMVKFKQLVKNSRDGMKLIMRGHFILTENRLRCYKESSSRRIRLQIPKKSLTMTEEVFEEVMGEDKQLIEFV
jgi:F-box-like